MRLIQTIRSAVCWRWAKLSAYLCSTRCLGWSEEDRKNYFFIDVQARGEYPNYAKKVGASGITVEMTSRTFNCWKIIQWTLFPSPTMPVGSLQGIQLKGRRQRVISFASLKNPSSRKLGMGLADWPSWSPALRWNTIWDRYQKPLFIVENGLGAVDYPEWSRVRLRMTTGLITWLPTSGHAGCHHEDGVVLWGGIRLGAVLTWSLPGLEKWRSATVLSMSTGTTKAGKLGSLT